ncbi:MAG TPA: tetratricopeptide repeat protein [Planctomycetaceae bacterium]|nr:tetratricopeptide repeat protein [Planctomycetaceae bacterium]
MSVRDSGQPSRRAESRLRTGVVVLAILLTMGAALTALFWRRGDVAHQPTSTEPESPKVVAAAASRHTIEEEYLGSAACVACHREIATAFQTHPMSGSLNRVADVAAPTEARVAGDRRVYAVETRDQALLHHELMYDASGELIYDQAVAMDYVVGSGRRAKAYLSQRGAILRMSPLNWYTDAQRWDLAPGYARDDPRRFDRRITDECLGCHAGRVATSGRGTNAYQTPAFHETSIGCENCHGPGGGHVRRHQSDAGRTAEADPIVNPAKLDPMRRESVCYQCHLQATVRIPRYGRTDLDFRPGQLLDDTWTVLDAGSDVAADGRTRSVNHVQQMRDSRCFQNSDGRFGCISCHDPHSVPAVRERDAFYRERCARCHAEGSCRETFERRSEQQDSCIACHMPARASSNVSHVSQTDHRVIRRQDDHDNAASPATARELDTLVFFNDAHLRLEPWEQERAMSLGARKYLSKMGRTPPASLVPPLLRILEKVPEDGAALVALGVLASEHGQPRRAREHFEAARKIPSAEEAALSGLLDLHYLAGNWSDALDCANRLIAIDPGDARTFALQAQALSGLNRTSDALAAARSALELNPTLIPVREWLADALGRAGRTTEQQEQQRILRRMRDARPP